MALPLMGLNRKKSADKKIARGRFHAAGRPNEDAAEEGGLDPAARDPDAPCAANHPGCGNQKREHHKGQWSP
jgi:hypothetical protein